MSSISLINSVQSVLINYINNIDEFKEQSINVFSSIPSTKKPPYLKITEISFLNQYQELIKSSTVCFKIAVVFEGKNNNKICDILDLLRKKLPSIYGSSASSIKIVGFSDFSFNIQDNLMENIWTGSVSFSLDVLELH